LNNRVNWPWKQGAVVSVVSWLDRTTIKPVIL
jgi:hypothetical protein